MQLVHAHKSVFETVDGICGAQFLAAAIGLVIFCEFQLWRACFGMPMKALECLGRALSSQSTLQKRSNNGGAGDDVKEEEVAEVKKKSKEKEKGEKEEPKKGNAETDHQQED